MPEAPKFFLPYIDDPDEAERIWYTVKRINEANWPGFTGYRIFRIEYVTMGRRWKRRSENRTPSGIPSRSSTTPTTTIPKPGVRCRHLGEGRWRPICRLHADPWRPPG